MISKSLEFAEKSEFSGEKPQKFEKRKKLGLDRPRDVALRPLATGGFFGFWENLKQRGLLPGSPVQTTSAAM
jgi:hypothetical protein